MVSLLSEAPEQARADAPGEFERAAGLTVARLTLSSCSPVSAEQSCVSESRLTFLLLHASTSGLETVRKYLAGRTTRSDKAGAVTPSSDKQRPSCSRFDSASSVCK